jgi:hypothetical protein
MDPTYFADSAGLRTPRRRDSTEESSFIVYIIKKIIDIFKKLDTKINERSELNNSPNPNRNFRTISPITSAMPMDGEVARPPVSETSEFLVTSLKDGKGQLSPGVSRLSVNEGKRDELPDLLNDCLKKLYEFGEKKFGEKKVEGKLVPTKNTRFYGNFFYSLRYAYKRLMKYLGVPIHGKQSDKQYSSFKADDQFCTDVKTINTQIEKFIAVYTNEENGLGDFLNPLQAESEIKSIYNNITQLIEVAKRNKKPST